jgi:hypothetical protein
MSDQDKEAPKGELLPALRIMAKLCGLREDFLVDLLLLEGDDWSFVVKAHALLESVVCQLLATHLKKPPLEFVFAQRVQMEDRIEILKAIEVTTSQQRQMMRLLGKLRNNLVHNAQQTDFKFEEYFKNKDNRRNFADSFGTSWPEQIKTNPPQSRVISSSETRSTRFGCR